MSNLPPRGPILLVAAFLGICTILSVVAPSPGLRAQAVDYERPVEAAPQAEDIGDDYAVPEVQRPRALPDWRHILDVSLLGAVMLFVAWVLLSRRNRRLLFWTGIFSLAYFGFYREGCVCPIGATQNIVVALVDSSYTVPVLVVVIFFLPLVAALFFGRVFCGGVCALGAIQDLFVVRPIQMPRRLDQFLGLFKYVYLGLAVWYALQPVGERDFIICRFDPFVGLFRRTGTAAMLTTGGGFLLVGMFVGRAYCRYVCPYGALLAIVSRLSWRSVTITPGTELDCGLCARACPFGAIEKMRAISSSCLSCARCYGSCPQDLAERGIPVDPSRPFGAEQQATSDAGGSKP